MENNLQMVMEQAVDIYFGIRQVFSSLDKINEITREMKEEIKSKFSLTEEEYRNKWNEAVHVYHNNKR